MTRLLKTKLVLLAVATIVAACGLATAQTEETFPAVHIDDALFADALLSFHKLANATELGVSYIDYKRLLLDAKTDFDIPIAKFPKSAQRKDLEEAMQDFINAADAWGFAIDNTVWCANRYQDGGMPTKNDFYRNLRTRYGENILPPPKTGQCNVKYEALLRLIWAAAGERIKHAAKLQKETP